MTLPVVFTANGPSGYNLTKSLRFRSSASAYLNRTFAGTPQTYTYSCWFKRGTLGVQQELVASRAGTASFLELTSSDTITCGLNNSTICTSTAVFRDPAAWYHVVLQVTQNSTVTIYVNNVSVATGTAGASSFLFNSSYTNTIGQYGNTNSLYFDGYMTEINFIDGQALTPSSFGSTNSLTGVWQPAKYTGTYGTNGFYLPFTNTASTTTLGYDFSGNSNNWTTNNLSLTTGSTYDSMTDVPTLTSATTANYCVLNPLNCNSNITLSNGNLSATSSTNGANTVIATMPIPSTGKAYWEYKITAVASSLRINLGAASTTSSITPTVNPSNIPDAFALNWASGFSVVVNGSYTYGPTGSTNLAVNDVVMIAYDATTGNLWGGLNGTWYNSGNPAAGTGSITTMTAGLNWLPYAYLNTSGGANATDVNFGQQPFAYTQPTGFNSINAYNLPTSTIVKGNTVMDATTYTGTGSALSVTNTAGFKSDLVWLKCRSNATNHYFTDSVRGTTKQIYSNSTAAEGTSGNILTAFNSNGFSLGTDAEINGSGRTNVAWQWQAGQGTTSSNTSGSITSTVSVNASAGFSVVTYTGTGSTATIGHGLGVAPSMIIVKRRDAGGSGWSVYFTTLPAGYVLSLQSTNGQANSSGRFTTTLPTSSVFSVGTDSDLNGSGGTYVAYCWSEIAGFSKFGSYTGNGSSDGPFVYTGFRPKFVMWKRTNTTGDWTILDTSRNPYNYADLELFPNLSDAETVIGGGLSRLDIVSNGFKVRGADSYQNASGSTYIYMAFAENPFKNALAR